MPHTYSSTKRGRTRIWFVPRLWELSENLTAKRVKISSLSPSNFSTIWFKKSPTFTQVLQHMQDVLTVDLRYPIILDPSGNIMDGYHRVTKALLLGKKTILVKQFDELPLPDKIDQV